jgi:glycosyltransferase involved in cell wall biosynthesis
MDRVPVEPLLTIAIPVYNSELVIGENLQSIKKEISQRFKNLIEVVLVDNASTDQTLQVISSVDLPCEKKIVRNLNNFGADFNTDECGRQSNGKYIWFLGSGERLLPNSLEKIISILEKEDCTNIVLNFGVENELNPDLNSENHYAIRSDWTSSDPYNFYRKVGGHALAMSANIIRRENYLTVLSRPLITKNWALYQRYFDSIFSNKNNLKFYFVAEPMFILRQEENGWWTTQDVFLNFIRLREIHQTAWKSSIKIFLFLMYRGGGSSLRNAIILGRQLGYKPTLRMLIKLMRLYFFDPRFFFMAFPLFYSPKQLVKYFKIS